MKEKIERALALAFPKWRVMEVYYVAAGEGRGWWATYFHDDSSDKQRTRRKLAPNGKAAIARICFAYYRINRERLMKEDEVNNV